VAGRSDPFVTGYQEGEAMGLDVWFQEDVARALRAARVAGQEARRAAWSAPVGALRDRGEVELMDGTMAAYWQGYEAALATLGAAFGLSLSETGAREFSLELSPSCAISPYEYP
jgi:hypothetical protein